MEGEVERRTKTEEMLHQKGAGIDGMRQVIGEDWQRTDVWQRITANVTKEEATSS